MSLLKKDDMLYMHTESVKKSDNIEMSCSPSLYWNTGSFRGPIFYAAKNELFCGGADECSLIYEAVYQFWGHEIMRQADLPVCFTEKVTGVTADYIGP